MLKIVLAPFCLQISLHQGRSKGQRLAKFIKLLKDLAIVPCCPPGLLKEKDLKGCKLLISTTRPFKLPYRKDEKDLIERFVQTGGNLLLMSNHDKHTVQDSKLAKRFGFGFDPTHFTSGKQRELLTLEDFEPPAHPILNHPKEPDQTLKVAVCNCSNINKVYEAGTPILRISPTAFDLCYDSNSTENSIFALAIDKGEYRPLGKDHGKILGISDSGLIGEPMQNNPGPALDARDGDNYLFMENAVKWLLGMLDG